MKVNTESAPPTFDIPSFNHPGWAIGSTTETTGGINKYDIAFSGITLDDFFFLCPVYGTTTPNDGISACDDLSCTAYVS